MSRLASVLLALIGLVGFIAGVFRLTVTPPYFGPGDVFWGLTLLVIGVLGALTAQ